MQGLKQADCQIMKNLVNLRYGVSLNISQYKPEDYNPH